MIRLMATATKFYGAAMNRNRPRSEWAPLSPLVHGWRICAIWQIRSMLWSPSVQPRLTKNDRSMPKPCISYTWQLYVSTKPRLVSSSKENLWLRRNNQFPVRSRKAGGITYVCIPYAEVAVYVWSEWLIIDETRQYHLIKCITPGILCSLITS